MEDIDRRKEFVLLRAKNWSFERISVHMKLSKRILIIWSKELKPEIQFQKQLQWDELRELNNSAEEGRLEVVRELWKRLKEEAVKRNLRLLSTDKIFAQFARFTDVLKTNGGVEDVDFVDLQPLPERQELHAKLFDQVPDSDL